MTTKAEILLDSESESGSRITTFVVTFPRFILAEFNTHRKISRNAASSRAMPLKKQIEQVVTHPFVPRLFTKNQPGMQAREVLNPLDQLMAQQAWLAARDAAVQQAQILGDLNVHKQHSSRILESWVWTTVIATATEWDNFFDLRNDSAAQPEFQELAAMMQSLYEQSTPARRDLHLPYVLDEEIATLPFHTLCSLSAARCARVSYLKHDKTVPSLEDDLALCRKLAGEGKPHMSPFEHAARSEGIWWGTKSNNFEGWEQVRRLMQLDRDFRNMVLGLP